MTAQRLGANTRTLAISNIGGAALSFALSALIGRSLGEAGLGAYAVALAWIYPLSLLVEFGLSTLLTRDAAADPSLADVYLRQMVIQRVTVGGAVMLAIILGAPFLSDDPIIQRGIILSAPMVILLPFFSTFSAVYRAHGDMQPIPYLNIGMLLAQVGLTVSVFLAGGGVLAALAVNTLTSAGQVVAAWGYWRGKYKNQTSPPTPSPLQWRGEVERSEPGVRLVETDAIGERSSRRVPTQSLLGTVSLMRAAFPFALAGVFAALQMRLTLILLESMLGTDAAGTFSAANRFIDAAKLLPNALFGALLPSLAALTADPPELQRVFGQSLMRLALYGTGVGLVMLVAAPILLAVVYGSGFSDAAASLAILGLGLVPALLRGGLTLFHYAFHNERGVNWINGLALLIQIAAGLALIPALGVVGGAIAVVVGDAAAWGLLYHGRKRIMAR